MISSLCESCFIFVEPAQPPLQEDYTSGKANRSQSVIAITKEMWEKLKAQYNMTTGYLPHRPVAQQNGLPSGTQQSQTSQPNGGKQTPRKSSKQTKLNGVTKSKNSKKEMEEESSEESSEEEEEVQHSEDDQIQVTRRSTNQKRVITDLDSNDEDGPQPPKRAKKSNS